MEWDIFRETMTMNESNIDIVLLRNCDDILMKFKHFRLIPHQVIHTPPVASWLRNVSESSHIYVGKIKLRK